MESKKKLKTMPVLQGQVVALNEFGDGEVHGHRRTVKLARTLPGDQVAYQVEEADKSHVYGTVVQILKPAPSRVESRCPAFEKGCGGCQWLHFDYPEQLRWKTRILREMLKERCHLDIRVEEIVAMADPFGFRNKLSLRNLNGRFIHMQDFSDQEIYSLNCLIEMPPLQALRAVLGGLDIPREILQLHTRGDEAGGVGVCLFVSRHNAAVDDFAQALLQNMGNIRGIGAQLGDKFELISGSAHLEYSDRGLRYEIPLNGFFQTNYSQARRLRDLALECLRPGPGDAVLDLYCGCGFFSLPLAQACKQVLGIENNAASTATALKNAKANGLDNCSFKTADVAAGLRGLAVGDWPLVLVDPPRQGCDEATLRELIRLAPRRLVYISCLASSLARDLKTLIKAGFRVKNCQPLDMFPHTAHLETVVCLERA